MSDPKKEDAIHSMQLTLQRSQKLEFRLRFEGDSVNASALETKNKELRRQIDKLIVKAIENWLKDAQVVTNDIKRANTDLQRAITNVKNKKQEADNIVKALGLVDDVISIAKSLLLI